MTIFRPEITLLPEHIRCSGALRRPGLTGQRIAGMVVDLLDLVARESLLTPIFTYAIQPVTTLLAGNILLPDQTTLHAPLVAQKLARMQYMAIATCTIGAALGARVEGFFGSRNGLRALVLDEIGNVAVRRLARRAQHRIRRDARGRGLQASSALCPGSKGFETERQPLLCRLASASRIGVTIRGDVMMQPSKSLCFVMGLGQDMPRWGQAEDCRNCRAASHCRFRVADREARP